ncbi:hypothetical protein OsJ_32714 [Oryza sativa Japonica Group]|uniref:non-specific serine/threonine protein kinase n=1 Tax=Oryza sativa subsp. japonica TaxID=39947 RepID=B9G917_ORYSJ|nr:hypothetical protein OsJ_32714 [Oryza sativa Japonica Group]
MEFCAGGDLHSLIHRMPSRRFPLPSAHFYAAEVLLAIKYLHMIGDIDDEQDDTAGGGASCFPDHLLQFKRRRRRLCGSWPSR